ncbi:very-long-chain 3-oxoacyl-CoA reductase-like [Centruroides sculpturatus]|uniref:very-long-chain 3-oxoacyl-CoA reductase-like n=1 Tax=Centruroides sculpturatus TaxID=218467 RepID=UPI000C6E69B5|nr:very-long-chain 3-oxoacyl-CoA reductase-like [Centruroides sculpturatus]
MEFGEHEVVLTYIGAIVCLFGAVYVVGKILDAVQTFLVPTLTKKNLRGFGKWAVITGGSSGIGRSYSQQFANLGYDILLISNELDELKVASEEVRTHYGVETQVICVDFSKMDEAYRIIKKKIDDKDVGVLVNNVGIRGNQPCYFLDESSSCLNAMANVNCLAAVMMTHLIIPQMLRKNKGIVINLCSVGALLPMAMGSIYSASKAFTDLFTRTLQTEYKETGIIIQGVSPFYVCTRMTQFSEDLSKPSFIVPESEEYVRNAMRTLGAKHFTSGYWPHSIMTGILYLLPVWFVQYLNFLQHDILKSRHNNSIERTKKPSSKEYFNWLKTFISHNENIENLDSKNL